MSASGSYTPHPQAALVGAVQEAQRAGNNYSAGVLLGLEQEYAFTLSASAVLKLATEEGKKPVGTEHLPLSILLKARTWRRGCLEGHGMTSEKVRHVLAAEESRHS